MKRTKEEAEQTRQALLDAAMTVFHQRGVARASLDQIACAAGLTRGALYWHFKNKEHLFEALCERHLAVMHEEMHHMLENDSPQAWDTLVQTHIGFLQRQAEDETFRQFFAILHLKCEETSWQSVNKLAALCTVRDELEEKQAPETQTQALPPTDYRAAYSTAAEPQSDFVAAASSVPFGGLMQVLDEHMKAIKLAYPKEYELVMRKISDL